MLFYHGELLVAGPWFLTCFIHTCTSTTHGCRKQVWNLSHPCLFCTHMEIPGLNFTNETPLTAFH